MNPPVARWLAVTASLVTITLAYGSATAAPGEKSADKVFVGYLFGENRNIDFKLYTATSAMPSLPPTPTAPSGAAGTYRARS